MPTEGYSSVSLKSPLYEKLDSIRRKLGARSVAEVIGYFVSQDPDGDELARKLKVAPVPRSR